MRAAVITFVALTPILFRWLWLESYELQDRIDNWRLNRSLRNPPPNLQWTGKETEYEEESRTGWTV